VHEALITGLLGLMTAISGYLLERRYGDRMTAIEKRLDALEQTEHDEPDDT